MRYRVAFAKRFQSDGRESGVDPVPEFEVYLPDGVVAEKTFVERIESDAQHSQEVLDEDDAFLGAAAPEVWEYDVVNERSGDFEDAIRNSAGVIEYDVIDEGNTAADDATAVALGEEDTAPRSRDEDFPEPERGGSNTRQVGDGPAGRSTVDRSAGGASPGKPHYGLNDVEGIANEGSGGIDDLNVVDAKDPSIGLTNYNKVGPDDWAANTGPAREPDRGIESDHSTDKGSTLAPDKRSKKR